MSQSRNRERAAPLARVHVLADRAANRGRPRSAGSMLRAPGLRVRDGRVVELDGRTRAEWGAADFFIARHGLDLEVVDEAMAVDEVTFGRMTVHPAAPREELARLAVGMTPAKLAACFAALRPQELGMAASRLQGGAEDHVHRGSAFDEVLVLLPLQNPSDHSEPPDGETPWSTALLVSSYAARGVRSRVVTGGSRPSPRGLDREALRPLVGRMVLARAIGAWGVAPARAGESGPRALVEKVVAALLGLDARSLAPESAAAGDFGSGAEGLRNRAAVLAGAGRPQLAGTFRRAAELLSLDHAEVDRLLRRLRQDGDPEDLTVAAAGLRDRGMVACAALVEDAAAYLGDRPG